MNLASLVRYARGDAPADLVLRNARVVNVFSSEIQPTDVAIAHSRIVGLGRYDGARQIDLGGAYVAPGFIDAHVHIESAMVPPGEFARAVVPHGTTTVVTDPHEIANVLGLDGIRFMFDCAKYGPLSMYVMASSCVPATALETSGAVLHAEDLVPFQSDPWVLGLAEVMDYRGVVEGDEEVLRKLDVFRDSIIDGHAPQLHGKALQAYVAAGIGSDHECTTAEEALDKLRLGMTIFIREGSAARNLSSLVPLVNASNERRFCFCTDDRQPADLLDEGHIDHLVRAAIQRGLDPILAIRMATWNPASYFHLDDRGAIVPGSRADLVVFDDLRAPRPRLVFRGGQMVARDGEVLAPPRPTPLRGLRNTMNVAWDKVNLCVRAEGRLARVIRVVPDGLHTEEVHEEPRIEDGCAVADPARDLAKLVVIERHLASGNTGVGFVNGLGLARGALASSVAHDHHNLVAASADDRSLMTAARRVAQLGGGMVAADGDRVLAEVALPLAGLMSTSPVEQVRREYDGVLRAAASLGSRLHDPLMTLSFLALEVIPALKLTDRGLVDAARRAYVPLWVDEG
ncbi:MAG: adenine deaminase [Bacteroidales bacterium]